MLAKWLPLFSHASWLIIIRVREECANMPCSVRTLQLSASVAKALFPGHIFIIVLGKTPRGPISHHWHKRTPPCSPCSRDFLRFQSLEVNNGSVSRGGEAAWFSLGGRETEREMFIEGWKEENQHCISFSPSFLPEAAAKSLPEGVGCQSRMKCV